MRDDDDADEDAVDHYDDHRIRDYGDIATARDTQAVSRLVKRYYTAAASGDGALVCSVASAELAKRPTSLETIPWSRDQTPLPAAWHSLGCARVATFILKRNRARLMVEAPTVVVAGVRRSGRRGLALLGFGTKPMRWIPVTLERGTWKIGALLDHEIP